MSDSLFAYYPLTALDFLTSGHTVGWLVEGILDRDRLEATLLRLVTKWPMLAGRVERRGGTYRLKIPLGKLEDDYLPFALTSNDSDAPITDFVELPLPFLSRSLPASLFRSPSAPTDARQWEQEDLPLTFWHLTYFRQSGCEYTCIGLTFSHQVFDGMGIAAVIHALEAESLGRPWPISPPQLLFGENENGLQLALDSAEKDLEGKTDGIEYHYMNILGAWFCLTWALWFLWQSVWHKVTSHVILFPAEVCDKVVLEARQAIAAEGVKDVRLSTGDVLAGWALKTVYSAESNKRRRICLSNQMCLRKLFKLGHYSHNCIMPLPYPIFTVAELQDTPLHALAHRLSIAKSSVSMEHALIAYSRCKELADILEKGGNVRILPIDKRADESLLMTNVTNGRVFDIDWTGFGGRKTVFRYKYSTTASSIPVSNYVTILGRMGDGRIALEVILNNRRMKALKDEIARLCKEAA